MKNRIKATQINLDSYENIRFSEVYINLEKVVYMEPVKPEEFGHETKSVAIPDKYDLGVCTMLYFGENQRMMVVGHPEFLIPAFRS